MPPLPGVPLSMFLLPGDRPAVLDANSPAAKSFLTKKAKETAKVPRNTKEQEGGQGDAGEGKELDCKKFEVDHAEAYAEASLKWPPFFVPESDDKTWDEDFARKIEPLSRRQAEVLWYLELAEGQAHSLNHIAARDLNQSLSWSASTEDLTPTMVCTAVPWVRGRAKDRWAKQGQSF